MQGIVTFSLNLTRSLIQKFWIVLVLAAMVSYQLSATHIRAAEITYRRITSSAFTYEFTLTGYSDTGSAVRIGDGIIDFGDGRAVQINLEAFSFEDGQFVGPNNETEISVVKILHTYTAPGQYRVSYREPNRNDEIVNINSGNSQQVPFHIESSLWVDPIIGSNSSPVLTGFPVDRGFVGQQFTHNPWAYDSDGDSLVYRLLVPLQDQSMLVPNFERPNHEDFYQDPIIYQTANELENGPPSFGINPFTGDLVWDAPGNLLENSQNITSQFGPFSEYNVAFMVEEWRKIEGSWRRLGHVTRDMQIIVTDQQNQRPDFMLPPDMIIGDSQVVDETITFSDPDDDPIKVELFGEVFDLAVNPMSVTPAPEGFVTGPFTLRLQWDPLSEHVRKKPYYVHLKITDQTADPLLSSAVTYKTWVLSFNQLPDIVTSIPELQPADQLKLFPNPVSQVLNWQLPSTAQVQYLRLYNSLGQQTILLDLTSNPVGEIDVSRLSPGLYIAEFYTGSNRYRKTFIKK